MGDATLDIAEVQVLINFPADAGGFFWHHRILLHRVEHGVWLTLTPDHDIERHDLNAVVHRVLQRRAAFPRDIAAVIYAHDPLPKATLLAFKRTAKVQASILGQGEVDETESFTWLVSESGHSKFGTAVDQELLDNDATGLAFSEKGVAVLDGEEVFVERVFDKDLEQWKKKKGLSTGDERLLGDHRDASGRKKLDLSEAVEIMKGDAEEDKDPDFPIRGVRAAKEFHMAVASGTNNMLTYHEQWLRQSGVGKRASAAHIHRNLCEGLQLLHSFDQIDSSTTAIGEHLCRWAIQTELAVERNPSQPDYAGLDIVSGSSLMSDGRAATGKFNEWVTSKLKERSQIWKQERLYLQERRHGKGKGGGKADDDDDDDEDGAKKRKKKKKALKDGKGGGKDPPATS